MHCTATCSLYTVHWYVESEIVGHQAGLDHVMGRGRMHRRPEPGNRRDLGLGIWVSGTSGLGGEEAAAGLHCH